MPPPVLPGAEPLDVPGGPVGVLLSHGFTGTTQSIRPWAEHLAAAGLTVRAPRLPGHGTTWQDMGTTTWQDWYDELERAFDDLRRRCESVFVMGLSMGGTLTLRLAQLRADEVAGIVVVNSSLASERRDATLAPLLSRVLPSLPGVGSDIKKPGVTELPAVAVALAGREALPPRGAVALLADLVLRVLLGGAPHGASVHGQSYATHRAGRGHVLPRLLGSTERRRTVAA